MQGARAQERGVRRRFPQRLRGRLQAHHGAHGTPEGEEEGDCQHPRGTLGPHHHRVRDGHGRDRAAPGGGGNQDQRRDRGGLYG